MPPGKGPKLVMKPSSQSGPFHPVFFFSKDATHDDHAPEKAFDKHNLKYDARKSDEIKDEEEEDIDDPTYIGPKMQVFSDDMPPKWSQLMMGFMDRRKDPTKAITSDGDDIGKDGCARGNEIKKKDECSEEVQAVSPEAREEKGMKRTPIYPREEYVRMWITCDDHVYVARLGGVLDKVENLLEMLEQRETRFVRAGAAKRKVDDMLEYSVRLATGAKVLHDEDAAFRTLTKVIRGQFPQGKIAVAHNMLCYLYKKRFAREAVLENLVSMLLFGNFAASSGPFTHCLLTLAFLFAPLRDLEPYKGFEPLWTKYAEYREKWGLVEPAQKVCAVCCFRPPRRRDIKRCAGSCLMARKPLYCGKACQRKHWLTHKQWCSKSFKPTESDIESDMFYSDFGSDYDDYLFTSSDEDDSEDEEGSWYTTDDDGEVDEGYFDKPSPKRPRLDSSGDDDDGEWFSGEEETDESSDEDRRSSDSGLEPSGSKSTRAKNPKKKRQTWNDPGDTDYFLFILNISKSVVRVRNT